MIGTLPRIAHEHHDRILATVDRLPALGDLLLGDLVDQERLQGEVREVRDFLVGTLLPHIEAAEAAIYPSLERMLQNRHSMAPMRREHAEIQRLVAELDGLTEHLQGSRITVGRAMALRRTLFQLYALLKIHLAEEEAYTRVVDHGVATDVSDLIAAQLEHPIA